MVLDSVKPDLHHTLAAPAPRIEAQELDRDTGHKQAAGADFPGVGHYAYCWHEGSWYLNQKNHQLIHQMGLPSVTSERQLSTPPVCSFPSHSVDSIDPLLT